MLKKLLNKFKASSEELPINIPGKVITLESLDDMFSNIEDQGQWDMGKEMLWGYFFTHQNPRLLEEIKPKLIKNGYNFVKIFVTEEETPEQNDKFWLHVERIEVHTPATLDKRNNELYLFAYKHQVDSYDGMDVGPVPN